MSHGVSVHVTPSLPLLVTNGPARAQPEPGPPEPGAGPPLLTWRRAATAAAPPVDGATRPGGRLTLVGSRELDNGWSMRLRDRRSDGHVTLIGSRDPVWPAGGGGARTRRESAREPGSPRSSEDDRGREERSERERWEVGVSLVEREQGGLASLSSQRDRQAGSPKADRGQAAAPHRRPIGSSQRQRRPSGGSGVRCGLWGREAGWRQSLPRMGRPTRPYSPLPRYARLLRGSARPPSTPAATRGCWLSRGRPARCYWPPRGRRSANTSAYLPPRVRRVPVPPTRVRQRRRAANGHRAGRGGALLLAAAGAGRVRGAAERVRGALPQARPELPLPQALPRETIYQFMTVY